MKYILITLITAFSFHLNAQKYFTKTGHTEFKASMDSFEPVEAINNSTTAIFNILSGKVAALVFINAFHFDIALMGEHFNENYLFSDLFPKAKFNGQFVNYSNYTLTEKAQSIPLKGTISIKGIEKALEIPVSIKKVNDVITVDANFQIHLKDFNIEIPGAVKGKVAKTVNIKLHYELKKKN